MRVSIASHQSSAARELISPSANRMGPARFYVRDRPVLLTCTPCMPEYFRLAEIVAVKGRNIVTRLVRNPADSSVITLGWGNAARYQVDLPGEYVLIPGSKGPFKSVVTAREIGIQHMRGAHES